MDDEPSLCGLTVGPGHSYDCEAGDDNGIADADGAYEQSGLHLDYDTATANKVLAHKALDRLHRIKPGSIRLVGICNVRPANIGPVALRCMVAGL